MTYNWKYPYDEKDLEKGEKLEVENFKKQDNVITAKVDKYEVEMPLKYNSPFLVTCNCRKKRPCSHEAALWFYIEKHPEIFEKDLTVSIVNSIDESVLKEFVINEIKTNKSFKDDFFTRFPNKEGADISYYLSRLNDIEFMGRTDYSVLDFDRMAGSLEDFLYDIEGLLENGEYEIGCELLCKAADLIGDDLAVTCDLWYDVAELFDQIADPMIQSIHVSEELRDKLSTKTAKVSQYI